MAVTDPMAPAAGSPAAEPPSTKKLSPLQAPSVNRVPSVQAATSLAPSAAPNDAKPATPMAPADPMAFATGPATNAGGFSTTPTVPGQDLRSSTIQAKSGLDRVGLANQLIQQQHAQAEPEWQRLQRALTQNAAANGQTGSGMFRTSLGDAARQHALDTQTSDLGFLADALKGGVEDDRFATNVAQQQQGFQEGQANTAFNQEQAIQNGDYIRSLQSLLAGNQGNPADVQLALSQIFGDQAGQANQALGSAIAGRQANQTAQSTADTYAKILQQLYGGGGAAGGSASTGIPGGDLVWGDY